ncbi:Uncharacterised protein [Mycobacteroides abscessus subsp. abscessus]|nr:Uncharacterised protein [Mycobacteroides abscessus subsp. abscessus]
MIANRWTSLPDASEVDAGINNIAVNFITYQQDMVLKAKITDLFEFLSRPNTTRWILRTAEDEYFHIWPCHFVGQIFKVKHIAVIF